MKLTFAADGRRIEARPHCQEEYVKITLKKKRRKRTKYTTSRTHNFIKEGS